MKLATRTETTGGYKPTNQPATRLLISIAAHEGRTDPAQQYTEDG